MDSETVILLVTGVILVVILIIVVVYLIMNREESNSGSPEQTSDARQKKITFCGCSDLMTHHPGQVKHLLYCRRFRELNPNLSVRDFLKYESFDKIITISDWPDLDNLTKEE